MPPRTSSATTTTGMTTAMAVLPPVLRPPLFSFCTFCSPVWLVLDGAEVPVPEGDPAIPVGCPALVLVLYEVMKMTLGCSPARVGEGVTVMMDVST
jgi:hypothetical protein